MFNNVEVVQTKLPQKSKCNILLLLFFMDEWIDKEIRIDLLEL